MFHWLINLQTHQNSIVPLYNGTLERQKINRLSRDKIKFWHVHNNKFSKFATWKSYLKRPLNVRQGYCYNETTGSGSSGSRRGDTGAPSGSGGQCRNPMTFKMSRMDCCCNFGTFWAENRGGQCDPCPLANSNEREKLCQSLHGPESQTRDVCTSANGNGNICPNGKCVPDKSKPGKIF